MPEVAYELVTKVSRLSRCKKNKINGKVHISTFNYQIRPIFILKLQTRHTAPIQNRTKYTLDQILSTFGSHHLSIWL
jgi:hypothetical protein